MSKCHLYHSSTKIMIFLFFQFCFGTYKYWAGSLSKSFPVREKFRGKYGYMSHQCMCMCWDTGSRLRCYFVDEGAFPLINPMYFIWVEKSLFWLWLQFGFHHLYDQQQRNLSLPMQTFCKEDSRKISHKWWSSADSLILPTLCVWWMLASLSSSRCWYRGSACPPAW